MATTLTTKGQVTIPKHIRDALKLGPGTAVDFCVAKDGAVVLRKVGKGAASARVRFEAVRGTAEVKWRSDELMALLRAD